jgi:alkylhydroperoxidase family enzyme
VDASAREIPNVNAYINPPKRMPLGLRFGIWIAERRTGRPMLAARLLAWHPKAAIGAGVMESLVAHQSGKATARLLKLVRLQVSFMASCPFCIDMNSAGYTAVGISDGEIEVLQGRRGLGEVDSFSREERLALRYARALTATPVTMDSGLLRELLATFPERELVVIASTIAQVNFWTRMIQGLGVPPAGFSGTCSILHLEDYATLDTAARSGFGLDDTG